jgi:hypothetical protein
VVLDQATGAVSGDWNQPLLAIPEDSNWEEAVDHFALQTAEMLSVHGNHKDPAAVANICRRQAMAWEPVVALLCDLLGRDKGESFDVAAAAVTRADTGLATVEVSNQPGLGLAFEVPGEPFTASPRGRLN